MSDLLEKIKEEHQDVAKVLQEADLRTDSDIRSLTGAELHQLFPEKKDIKLRRTVFDIIHKQKSVVQLLREMKDISDALTDNGVLVDNLPILKEMQTHTKDMQSFLDGRIYSLEANIQNQPNQESVTNVTKPGDNYCPEGAQGEVMSDLLEKIKEQHQDVAKVLQGKLMYRMVVTGTTFDAHDQLTEKVKNEVKNQFDLVQSNSNDYDVTIVFCPIVSRMGPDVESALRDVKGDKPVILVLMHHAYETKFIPNVQQGANVQLQVNVFFHETKHGLLNCGENGAVVCEITKYLKEIPIPNAQVVAAAVAELPGSWEWPSWTPRWLH